MKRLCYIPAIAALTLIVSCKDEKAGASSSSTSAGHVLAKKDHVPKAGTKLTTSKTMAMKNGVVNVKAGGQEMKGTAEMSESQTETLDFVSADKVKAKLTASKKEQKMVMNGQAMPEKPETNALLDVPVVLTKSGGEWTAALESGTPSPEQTTELKKKGKQIPPKDDKMYGTDARKIGDTWTVDAKDFPYADADGNDDMSGDVKLTFKGVEDYNGKKCARLEGPMELKGKTAADKGGQDMSLKGDMVILRSLDDMVDLKVDFTGKMEMKGEIPGGSMDMGGDMTIKVDTKIE